MALFMVFTRADASTMQKLALWLFGLPVKGVHAGGGIHVDMPDTAPNPCPKNLIGWATRACDWIAYPGNAPGNPLPTDQFAIRVTQTMQDLWAAKKSQLTPAQRTWVQSHLDTAAALAADWLSTINGQQVLDESADVVPDP